jgi:hypothetical protein
MRVPATFGDTVKLITAPPYSTARALVRRAKTAHGLSHIRHTTRNGVGPDGSYHIAVLLSGVSEPLIIETDGEPL